MKVLMTDIAHKINSSDIELNTIIQQFINDHGLVQTVEEWRIANYYDLRRWAYPPIGDSIGALLTGGTELADLKIATNVVKSRFPKV